MSSPSIPPTTERQALVSLAKQMAALVGGSTEDGGITMETAIAALMVAVVSRGGDYSYDALAALTMTREGRARVEVQDLSVLQEILTEIKALRLELQLRTGIQVG